MANLIDTIAYVCDNYPHKSDLSKAKLNKIIYLADWKSAMSRGRQITDIDWIFNNYGPYVNDIETAVVFSDYFELKQTLNMFGNKKEVIVKISDFEYEIYDDEKQILDFVINKVTPLNWDTFIKMVYSTYPILKSNRHEHLNLVELATEYNHQ